MTSNHQNKRGGGSLMWQGRAQGAGAVAVVSKIQVYSLS